MSTFAHALPFGAHWEQGNTRFRVWAPSCDSLSVRVEGAGDTPLPPAGDGCFEGRVDCRPGARYRYVTHVGDALADPASRAQHE
ncbi:MAG: malto-oligosyltrehalose trehalohydrolase, partial [Pseudomonadota bacterium]|nr:malto-oligosyltrehalose trehalohydrolase [Pseudomonadota bacterium]